MSLRALAIALVAALAGCGADGDEAAAPGTPRRTVEISETEFALLIGTPVLTGSLSRVFLGAWADRIGGRRLYALVMVLAAIATFLTAYAHTYPMLLLAALGVGLAGGAFPVGVAYVSSFYPASRQGTVLGIFGAGNVGAAVTKFLAPFIMVAAGWEMVAQVWAVALILTAIIGIALAS